MTPTQQVDEAEKQRIATFDYSCRRMTSVARTLATNVETSTHYKDAYSRALDFVCAMHYPALPAAPGDDQFFKSPDGNCCATDILTARCRELEEQVALSKTNQITK